MYKLSKDVNDIFNKLYELECPGSDDLLILMYKNHDSIVSFLLSDYNITLDDILTIKEKIISLRKKQTNEIDIILEKSYELSKKYESDLVYDEHVFISILETNCLAKYILEAVGLDINELILDIKDIFSFKEDEKLTKNLSNTNSLPLIGREEYIEKLDIILNRKIKNNPLLIGEAGVGKTAIVEGLANFYKEKNIKILELNLGLALSGSKYRGDFEEKLMNVVKLAEGKKDVILFIDEIHNLIGCGASDGGIDAANLLKPILSRGNIKIIGATTIDEYKKKIEQDKALSRRFEKVFVYEPNKEETLEILKGIKKDFESFHQIKIDDSYLEYIVNITKPINRRYPDKAIDVLDEVMSKCKIKKEKISYEQIDDVAIKRKIKNDFLKKYLIRHYFNYNEGFICRIKFNGTNKSLNDLIKRILDSLNMTEEIVLLIDLEGYVDKIQLTSLIGSPPGYVGYNESGVLNHLEKYPISILVIKNLNKATFEIIEFFKQMIKNGYYFNKNGTKISLNNTIFIDVGGNSLGFLNKQCDNYDLVIDEFKEASKLENTLHNFGYEIENLVEGFDDEILELLYDLPKGKYKLKLTNGKINVF